MSSEIIVSETPNWLNDLEAKREKRLKAKLGHEAGAGAPCLKCEDKCPGLDLHFWRKACKVCRCPKEDHDVPDDDIYGWAQFQLLGSKPNKIKTKIVLPGKNDEVELEWAPKGHKDTVDKYLKTLPPEALPVKGSQAAQERKQQLQKQIPVHDIDPALCHELNEDEVAKMEDYIAHIKNSSVGVGQIVNLSSVIKANLYNISPEEAHIIASRYSKGVPLSEIIKLQAGLAKNLENLTLKNKAPLPKMQENTNNIIEENLQNPLTANKFKDVTHPWYASASPTKGASNSQYSEKLNPKHAAIDEKLLQKTNFDPSKTPSQFLGYNTPGHRPDLPQYGFENPYFNQPEYFPNKHEIQSDPQFAKAPKSAKDLIYSMYDPSEGPVPKDQGKKLIDQKISGGYNPNETLTTYKHGPAVRGFDPETEKYSPEDSRYPKEITKTGKYVHDDPQLKHHGLRRFDPVTGKYIVEDQRNPQLMTEKGQIYGNMNNPELHGVTDFQSVTGKNPALIQGNTYEPETGKNSYEDQENHIRFKHNGVPKFDHETGKYIFEDQIHGQSFDTKTGKYMPENQNIPESVKPSEILSKHRGVPNYDPVTGKYIFEDQRDPKLLQGKTYNPKTGKYSSGDPQGSALGHHSLRRFDPITGKHIYEDPRHPEELYGNVIIDPKTGRYLSVDPTNPGDSSISGAKNSMSTLHPGHINVPEDYLEPHMVNIGAIQDINPDIRSATAELNPGFLNADEEISGDYSPESIREILNNIKLPDCHHCKKPFDENEFAVTIDRANMLFHSQCFKCAGCNQSLADNIYFYDKESNNVYCGRDYAKIRGIPRCSACDELIFTKEYCLAENATFHLKHFCCFQCDIPLAGQEYTLEEEKPYCLPCFETSKAASCGTCEKVIKPDEVGCQLNGVHFHAEDRCFRCIVCSVPLMGKKLLLRNDKLYCSHECFNQGKKVPFNC
ncbi:unnamed protein product [Ceutorhynchus assimilis]|uniref:LIM zinc-binding domain-containing protein n=1 Tax=Ceutorhynchus assimilis TaxID=467358 RepID=A0A9N9MPZ8_9CUCU|nr:unnamed protein product [Ceutorhynchus assimilis]